MHVELLLDQKPFYTAYDSISGTVAVSSTRGSDCEEIVVKLECESISRVVPDHPGSRTGHGLGSVLTDDVKRGKFAELHKTLYRTARVWPTPDLLEDGPQKLYRLDAGEHAFPFNLQFPARNTCNINDPPPPLLSLTNPLERIVAPTHHVRKGLPPILSMGPMAEIRYFIKVTVKRPHFKSIRLERPISYVPPGIPPSPSAGRAYASQNLSFAPPPSSSSRTLFAHFSNDDHDGTDLSPDRRASRGSVGPVSPISPVSSKQLPSEFPSFNVHMSLPASSVFTCGQPFDLQLEVEQTGRTKGHSLSLDNLDISITGLTRLSTYGCQADETDSFVLFTKSRINFPIDDTTLVRTDEGDAGMGASGAITGGSERNGNTGPGATHRLPSSLWASYCQIPEQMTPSFSTCSIERSYTLEVRVGLTHYAQPDSQPMTRHVALTLPFVLITGVVPTNVPPSNLDAAGHLVHDNDGGSGGGKLDGMSRRPRTGSRPSSSGSTTGSGRRGLSSLGRSDYPDHRTSIAQHFQQILQHQTQQLSQQLSQQRELHRQLQQSRRLPPRRREVSFATTSPSNQTHALSSASPSELGIHSVANHPTVVAERREDELEAPPPSYAEAMMDSSRSSSLADGPNQGPDREQLSDWQQRQPRQ